jgi:hypothetical protein
VERARCTRRPCSCRRKWWFERWCHNSQCFQVRQYAKSVERGCTYACAACAVRGDIYIFGGFTGILQAFVFKFDTEANEWSTLTPMPLACAYHSACLLGGLIYVVCWAGASGSETLRFDPSSTAWTTLAPTLISRGDGASFVVGGSLYAAGGRLRPLYDVAIDTWKTVADMLEGRI